MTSTPAFENETLYAIKIDAVVMHTSAGARLGRDSHVPQSIKIKTTNDKPHENNKERPHLAGGGRIAE